MIIICKWDSYSLFNSTELCVHGQWFNFFTLWKSLSLFRASQWRSERWFSVICCLIRVHRLLLWGPREDKPPTRALPLQLWRSWLTGPMKRETVPGEVEIRLSSITRTVPPRTPEILWRGCGPSLEVLLLAGSVRFGFSIACSYLSVCLWGVFEVSTNMSGPLCRLCKLSWA